MNNIKTILIATDFSDAAQNASKYGLELAKYTKSKVILLNSYHIIAAMPVVDIPVTINYEERESEMLLKLMVEKNILDPHNELDIECIVLGGFAVDNILEIENLKKPDLIIMGMSGASKLSEFMFGSITTAFISRTATPVIVVPEKAGFVLPKKITFACDYQLDPELKVLEPLLKFTKEFNSEISILNFLKRKDLLNLEKAETGMTLENYLKDVSHSYYFEEDKDFVHGIIHFTESHKTDMIAIVPHKHSKIQNLFKESHTKQLAFHSLLPLLAIPERKSIS